MVSRQSATTAWGQSAHGRGQLGVDVGLPGARDAHVDEHHARHARAAPRARAAGPRRGSARSRPSGRRPGTAGSRTPGRPRGGSAMSAGSRPDGGVDDGPGPRRARRASWAASITDAPTARGGLRATGVRRAWRYGRRRRPRGGGRVGHARRLGGRRRGQPDAGAERRERARGDDREAVARRAAAHPRAQLRLGRPAPERHLDPAVARRGQRDGRRDLRRGQDPQAPVDVDPRPCEHHHRPVPEVDAVAAVADPAQRSRRQQLPDAARRVHDRRDQHGAGGRRSPPARRGRARCRTRGRA